MDTFFTHLLTGIIGFLAGLKAREIYEVWKATKSWTAVFHHIKHCPYTHP